MQPDLKQITTWALGAGKILKDGFGLEHRVTHKSAIDLVTEMDHQSEEFLLGEIQANFPAHSILSEESGAHPGDADHQWYVDPLDGTINYAHAVPIFTVSIAYSEHGQLTFAVVYDPMLGEVFAAERGRGAFLNGQPMHVSLTSELIKSLLVTGFPYDVRTAAGNNLDHFAHFVKRTQGVRRLGSAALDLAYVAAGRFDGYWELGIKPWDIAAGALLVEQAGGTVTDLAGGKDYFTPPYALIAANPILHREILSQLK
jgi:myo-inositol-1(or 4)-monophosphatase